MWLKNRLLAALPEHEYQRLAPHLKQVSLPLGKIVYESGARQDYAYFPLDCIVSMLYAMENGSAAEMAITGNEGVVGLATFMGGEAVSSYAVIQSAGEALRMPGKELQTLFAEGGALQSLLLRYIQALITQISQTAVCNRLHTVDQQLCRWLLLSRDRLPTDELIMTQELMSHMLGVRREGVTVAAGQLQDAGLIRYQRGRVTILDRDGLEARACECYGVVKREFKRLLG